MWLIIPGLGKFAVDRKQHHPRGRESKGLNAGGFDSWVFEMKDA